MVFAKTSKASSRLSEQVRNKTFKKSYLAIVDGKTTNEKDTLRDYLWKDEKKNASYVVRENKKNAKEAVLDYEVLKYDEELNLSVLKINLHTGRHHQIRVQLSHLGNSIYGDNKYGKRGQGKQICLWAYKLSFLHPVTKEELSFIDLPEINGSWKIIDGLNIE